MIPAPIPQNEDARLAALQSSNILNSKTSVQLDSITQFAANMLSAPISLVTVINSTRQMTKSVWGIETADMAREISFCGHAIYAVSTNIPKGRIFEVNNTNDDDRFFDNPLVLKAPKFKSYIGYVLQTESAMNIGTLCVIDTKPREFTVEEKNLVIELGIMAENVLHGRPISMDK